MNLGSRSGVILEYSDSKKKKGVTHYATHYYNVTAGRWHHLHFSPRLLCSICQLCGFPSPKWNAWERAPLSSPSSRITPFLFSLLFLEGLRGLREDTHLQYAVVCAFGIHDSSMGGVCSQSEGQLHFFFILVLHQPVPCISISTECQGLTLYNTENKPKKVMLS